VRCDVAKELEQGFGTLTHLPDRIAVATRNRNPEAAVQFANGGVTALFAAELDGSNVFQFDGACQFNPHVLSSRVARAR
jgi:hypothetical protein